MRMTNFFCVLLALAALSACTMNNGTQADLSQVKQFKVGQTTLTEVRAALGPPSVTTQGPDGSVTLVYSHSKIYESALNLIPGVMLFAGKNGVQSQSESLQFDARGVLKGISSSSSGACKQGILGNITNC